MIKKKPFLLFLLVFFFIPSINAQEIIDYGSSSRLFLMDNSIEQNYSFDGSNYMMITKYGNYSFLDPYYIMEYYNLDGVEVIDKSIWVLQHYSFGSWESLEDFVNIELDVNETQYVLEYGINVKEKGENYIIANISMGFYSSGFSMNKPKIIINMTKTPEWDNLGYGSHRFIWNVVPKGNYFNYINTTLGQNTDIRTNDVFGNQSIIHIADSSDYSDYEQYISIDVSDYGIIPFKGGDENYWNGKGFTLIFPTNETHIDPVIVGDGWGTGCTEINQQRKLFRNPRGLEYYYAFYEGGNGYYYLANSSDGITWNRVYDFASGVGQLDSIYMYDHPDLIYFEDDANNRTIMYVTFISRNNNDLYYQAIGINDTGAPKWIYSRLVGSDTDDGIWNANIEIDDDGYVWICWTDEYTGSGKQRNDLYAIHTQTAYPSSWTSLSNAVKVYDGSALTENPSFNIISELSTLYSTADMGIVFSVDEDVDSYELNAVTATRAVPISGNPTTGNEVPIYPAIAFYDSFTSIAETEANSDVFIAIADTGWNITVFEWDISGDSVTTFSSIAGLGSDSIRDLVISIDEDESPDEINIIGLLDHVGEAREFSIFTSNVTTGDLIKRINVYNHSADDIYTGLSGYWISNNSIMWIYTNGSFPNYVYFHQYVFNVSVITPSLLYGAGFNASNAFIEIYWTFNSSLFTDFEVQNSTDGISWSTVSYPVINEYNDTSSEINNGTYRYYRVRARLFVISGYQNSSWSNVNLERAYFIKGGGGGVSTQYIYVENKPIFPIWLIAIFIIILVLIGIGVFV